MTVTVQDLAALVQGTTHGPADRVIRAARSLREAGPDDISFLEHERNLRHVGGCKAGALVVPCGMVGKLPGSAFAVIEVADPLLAFVAIVQKIQGRPAALPAGVSPQASVHPTAKIGPGCTIQPFAVVGENAVIGANCRIHSGVTIGADCVLGDDCVLHPNAVLYERTVLGKRVIVHAGTVLGADGFGYRFQQGRHVKVPQLGHVEVGDDVEIGANTTVDCGTFQATRIGDGTKIDNLVMIAHNCRIGRHNLIVSQVGIAGSSETGDYVVIAGQVGVADHVIIGDGVQIGAGSGVHADLAPGQKVLGVPARPEREAKRILLSLPSLPEVVRDVRAIKRQLGMPQKEAG